MEAIGLIVSIVFLVIVGIFIGVSMDDKAMKKQFTTYCHKPAVFDDRCLAAMGIK